MCDAEGTVSLGEKKKGRGESMKVSKFSTESVEGGVGDVQILEECGGEREGDEQVQQIRGGKEIKRKERKEVRWKGREREKN